MRLAIMLTSLAALCLSPRQSAGQQRVPGAPSAADSALATCIAATERGTGEAAWNAAASAERLVRDAVARQPGALALRVALARVLLQCRVPILDFVEQAALFREAVEWLRSAVALDSLNWSARHVLALALARSPAMLGLTDQAIAHLEWLAVPGRTPPEHLDRMADVYMALGDLYVRRSRPAQARRVWRAGGEAFPADSRFRARLATLPPGGSDPAADSSPPPAAARAPVVLNVIEVTAAAPDAEERRSGRVVTSLDVVTTPGGAADLPQALLTMPGVTGGSESSDLALRGGDPAEAPVFLNGARLAYASKFESLHGGMFGVLDPAVLRSARVLAGGFSARFGNALSGVIDVEAVGRPEGRTWRIGVNSAGLGGTVMLPLGERSGAWLSARGTHTGVLLAMHGRHDEFPITPLSLEGMAGAMWSGSSGDLAVVGLLEADDGARNVSAGGYRGAYESRGTTAAGVASARLTRAGPFSAARLTAALSQRVSGVTFGALDRTRTLRRADLDAQADWVPSAVLIVKSGIQVARTEERASGRVPATGSYLPSAPVQVLSGHAPAADHLGAFTEARLVPTGWLTVTGGVRVDRLPGEGSWTLDPRLGAAVRTGAWTAWLGGGVFQQGRFRAGMDQPGSDTRTGVARRAHHVVASVERRGRVTARLDAYVKRYDLWVDGDSAFRATSGRVQGADLFVTASGRGRSGWLTYSLAQGRLSLPGGTRAPTAFDVTHSLVAVARQQLAPGWQVGVTLRWATGRPFTPIVGAVAGADSASPRVPTVGSPNSDRYPRYGRLDARLSRYVTRPRGLLVLFAEVLNVTGRANILAYGYDESFTVRQPVPHFFGQRTVVLGLEAQF